MVMVILDGGNFIEVRQVTVFRIVIDEWVSGHDWFHKY